MKSVAASLFILLLASSLVSAATYSLPGGTYNNIGVMGEVLVDLNVTLLNIAPFPKFVIVNPRYDFTVYRLDKGESVTSFLSNDTVFQSISNAQRTTLNYYTGFWIMPYETVVVNFRITSNHSYVIPALDYRTVCGDYAKITSVEYNGSNLSEGVVQGLDDIGVLTCGVLYPQLINTPKVIYLRGMFPINDGYVKILKYEGDVTFRLTNVPNEAGIFNTFFAVAIPVIFNGANVTDFTPNYTMTYKEYMEEFVWRYKGLNRPQRSQPVFPSVPGMFQLSDSLISGIPVGVSGPGSERRVDFDFPVWIVFMGRSVDIAYHVSWRG
ncbi:hypothetical protein A3L12_00100 [Thermococcus sp. P6]|uniref:hypothetical protein n=1 Tax=Thermococcus sp. P6 TaxID=122420 RepID=UPI000B599096|nr:hypothetical protein [Thermococcus sp. P6]ASJ09815.1 hypothetical protein A3L12_00100 [Thermococcus sp. P6]